MRHALTIALLLTFSAIFASETLAQSPSAFENANELQMKIRDLESREAALLNRARFLDDAIKPENIERSLAGVGSTRPEDLRETRRRQLNIERESVKTQLDLLGQNRERLEVALRRAEAQAYQQSAEGFSSPIDQIIEAEDTSNPRWLVGMLAGLLAILGGLFATVVSRGLPFQKLK